MFSIPGYRIFEPIHEGDKTIVYKAQRVSDEMPVMLKTLRVETPSVRDLGRLSREHDILANLDHPRIIESHELHHTPDGMTLVLEDFGGIALQHFLAGGKLDVAAFFPIAKAIVEGLDAIHKGGIVHKDINPTNLVYNPHNGVLKIIDFGISSQLAQEETELGGPTQLEGTLAYLSPEQTGRMNRAVDFRTDYYALGATFFELLTGRLVFETDDAIEMVHCHIARKPPSALQFSPCIPESLAAIIDKLLAKNPEDRYQSNHGLRLDLEMCARQLEDDRPGAQALAIGQFDFSDQLRIPAKLYGRESEIERLMAAFEAVSGGDSRLVLISGYAGIGKSTLVREIHKPVVHKRGYFISGKFDQFKRNVPYASLFSAFTQLVQQILSESEASIGRWRDRLQQNLGDQAQVIVDVIPDLELILGPPPAVSSLPARESQNRFNLVFQNFIKSFTAPSHPLVLFLDDLQWADMASLKLLEYTMIQAESRHLMVIGAYRDHETSPTDPLILTLNHIEESGVAVDHIMLRPLDPLHVNRLLADTLHCPVERCLPLTELCMKKTLGNPFFLNHFLNSLFKEGRIHFDRMAREWCWDVVSIAERDMTDNVIDLMISKIRKLSQQTQEVLKLAACIGSRFSLKLLSIVREETEIATSRLLWEGLRQELIVPVSSSYKFLVEEQPLAVNYRFQHDRVRHAAYAMIADREKPRLHRKIGRLLYDRLPIHEREDRFFDILNHLNAGIDTTNPPGEALELAKFNLHAGSKAKRSAAYEPAYNYLMTGISLIGEEAWSHHYELMLKLHEEAVEAAFQATRFEDMDQLAAEVIDRAKTLLDKAVVISVQIDAMVVRNKMLEAIDTARPVLRELGVELPERSGRRHLLAGLLGIRMTLLGKNIEDLADLPRMTDPHKVAAMRIMNSLFSATYRAAPQLFPLLVFKVVALSIRYGNNAISPFGFACYGLVLCGVVGDVDTGYRFGNLGLHLLERLDAKSAKSRTYFVTFGFIRHWKEHVREMLEPLREAFTAVMESGDLEYASHAIYLRSAYGFFTGAHLPSLDLELARYGEGIAKLKQETTLGYNRVFHQTVVNLMQKREEPWLLKGDRYAEDAEVPIHTAADDKHALFCYHLCKLVLCYLFRRYEDAETHAEAARDFSDGVIGFYHHPLFDFYDMLTSLAVYPSRPQSQQRKLIKHVDERLRVMRKWKAHAPMNYRHKVILVEAERSRVLGNEYQAMELYDRAITLAAAAEYHQEEALAQELAARLYMEKGREKLGRGYVRDALFAYEHWGALAKVKHLETLYPGTIAKSYDVVRNTLTGAVTASVTATVEEDVEMLDLASVIKASQTISGEIELGSLLEKLLVIAIENAGAEKGVLLMERDGFWRIEAEGHVDRDQVDVLHSVPLDQSKNLCRAMVGFVSRTRRSLVLHDASCEGSFTKDPYVLNGSIKSVLCAPLLHQGKITGILYLENNLATGAFTAARLEVLQLLSAQIAVSIENARRYATLQHDRQALEATVAERTRELQDKNRELVQTQKKMLVQEKMASLGTLTAGIAHEIKNPLNFVNNFAEVNLELMEELAEALAGVRDQLTDAQREDYQELMTDLKRNTSIIHDHGTRANKIVQSMMMLSKGGKATSQLSDINKLVEESTNLAYHGMRATGKRIPVQIVHDFDANLPQVDVVPQDIGRVFLNLANNAMDAMAEKMMDDHGYKPVLKVTTRDEEGWVKIVVRDNGKGIPPEVREKIFTPFFTTKPTGEGNSGLGLSISYDVVTQEHQGEIEVVSEPGSFTEFHISLPKSPKGAFLARGEKLPKAEAEEDRQHVPAGEEQGRATSKQ
ncbi:AAA family ATPase [Sulfidibacter corallicola]|uniref:histidine kinase n=1 Tax=Sulfidibacter corallicola TaxID=2818388 RepID=A0A8A4TY12_SULCO|nr:ATP-binding sensor histidine kinase [Sulfidibacter corallicola]QTD54098.1 AAA family ATPase [Sulfidibacter corallicola]